MRPQNGHMSTEARRTVSGARSTVGEAGRVGWGSWPPPTPGDRPLSMTSRADRAEHAVMASELEQANRTGQPPMGLCGTVVDLAPLGATAQHVCRPCREVVSRRRRGTRPSTTPWTLLVQWYEALVRLLRGGLAPTAPKALTAGSQPPRALPAPPRPAPPPVPPDRPVPSPRPRTSLPARALHPPREPGGRHRRD